MIAIINWADFHMRFLKTADQVFVYEEQEKWCFYAHNGPIILKSIVDKSDDRARNAAFVDRYLNNINIVKIISYDEQMQFNFDIVQKSHL